MRYPTLIGVEDLVMNVIVVQVLQHLHNCPIDIAFLHFDHAFDIFEDKNLRPLESYVLEHFEDDLPSVFV